MLKRKNAVLQRQLEKALLAKGWGKYVERKLLSVGVADLTRKRRVYYAGVNDNVMMYAASLPKIAILVSVIEAVAKGKLRWGPTYDRRLSNMIQASSNSDASWATDLVGLFGIENTMRNPRYCFYDESVGGLWVGRAYRRGGASNRDPLHNISHGATARQATRFYVLLESRKLVTPHWSFRMLGLMSPPKHHHKFVGGLKGTKGVVFLARKSGTWRNFHADSALIQHQGRVYAIVGISEIRSGESIMRELVRVVDTIMMKGEHRRKKRRKLRR